MDLRLWSPWFDREVKWTFPWVDRFFPEFGQTFHFRPLVDVYRENGSILVKAELPGIDPEKDFKITLEGDMLVLSGEKILEKEVKDGYLQERFYGHFERRIPLPDGVETAKLTAKYEKGVLTVMVPMPTPEKPVTKQIPVTVA